MGVVTFELFQELMSLDICFEILFFVNGNKEFDFCWMGKMPDEKTKQADFWYGLTPDDKNEYDYPTFEEFSSAKVFDGKSLSEIWGSIVIKEINGCDPIEILSHICRNMG